MLSSTTYTYDLIQSVPITRGIYAIWLDDKCIYVGKSSKLRARVKSHYSGQRGSDQFCLYLYDSYIKEVLKGQGASITKVLNSLTKQWARDNLVFSYFECTNDSEEESNYRKSMKPTLNPL